MPNAFTPDNDGVNDAFFAVADSVQIFNLQCSTVGVNWFKPRKMQKKVERNIITGTHYCPDALYTWKVEPLFKQLLPKEAHVTLIR